MKKLILKRKLFLKLFSLFSGVFIWMYVVSSAEVEVTFDAPITIEVPKGLAIKNEMNREIKYRFKGPGLFVRKFLEKKIRIDIKKDQYFKKRKFKYNISMDQFKFKLPLGVELLSIEPRDILVLLESSKEKSVEIKPIFSHSILNEFNIKELKVFPRRIKVTGPKSVVRSIKSIETKLITELNKNSGDHFAVELISPDSRVKLEEYTANVSYTVQSKIIEFTYTDVPIIFQSVSLIKSATPKLVKVIVSGSEVAIESLSRGPIQVVALISNGSKGKKEIELIAELPPGIKLIKIIPKVVSVNLE